MEAERPEFHRCDIKKIDADAIVNAASSRPVRGGGADGAIRRASGLQLKPEPDTFAGLLEIEMVMFCGFRPDSVEFHRSAIAALHPAAVHSKRYLQ